MHARLAYAVQPLTRELAHALLPELLRVETALQRAHGDVFSHESWEERHFLAERPGKWDHSAVALDPSGHVIAFWIASRSVPAVLHTHRVGVDPAQQAQGVGSALHAWVERSCRAEGCRLHTLTVRAHNTRALAFYRRLGFERVRPGELVMGGRPYVYLERSLERE